MIKKHIRKSMDFMVVLCEALVLCVCRFWQWKWHGSSMKTVDPCSPCKRKTSMKTIDFMNSKHARNPPDPPWNPSICLRKGCNHESTLPALNPSILGAHEGAKMTPKRTPEPAWNPSICVYFNFLFQHEIRRFQVHWFDLAQCVLCIFENVKT